MAQYNGPLCGARLLSHLPIQLGESRTQESARAALFARLEAEGFDAWGVAPAQASADTGIRLAAFLEAGLHGHMQWLARRAHWRSNPKALWSSAKSAIVVALNYAPADNPLERLKRRRRATISAYAQNADYHDILKRKLKAVARWLAQSQSAQVKVFVDTAPVMEKPLAGAAGLGWQGKHTNLVSREFGSWLFLGVILTDLDLGVDDPQEDHCGQCQACLDVCPTKAFPAPYQLDARRCISYLTIEHNGHIPQEFRAAMGNRIYGCDDCLAVCPWNKFAQSAREIRFHPRAELQAPELAGLAMLDDASFRELFSGSPVKRIGRHRFVRNVLIAMGNSDAPELAASAEALLKDESSLVRGAAVWALMQLLPRADFEKLAQTHLVMEHDVEVQNEWAGWALNTESLV